ncbi:mlr0330 [Mesorhizobium japonicum MAFF 303099]|uniref:Mlr0330 protein n=1 Tax=Mesorhizobium japonicum (strain LMG 29417 / CECT 9101 / MAFF 303099) TaxID=266835 RepID=Q98N29_RHILO|nr:mlr0330 [Mesorhizobium japonicum MAFF 303099]
MVVTLRSEASPWGISTSVALHALLAAMLALMPLPKRPKRLDEERVSVDILTPQQFEASTRPPAPAPLPAPEAQASAPTPTPSAPRPTPPTAPTMIRPTEMLSAKTLADPRSRQARADLATFASDERMVQLCNLEAMDQIRRWRADFRPERVVPYATAEEKVRGTTIAADGAAFRSRKNWYSLKFKCRLARDGESVIGFEFLVGDPVARDKWDELGLPAVH